MSLSRTAHNDDDSTIWIETVDPDDLDPLDDLFAVEIRDASGIRLISGVDNSDTAVQLARSVSDLIASSGMPMPPAPDARWLQDARCWINRSKIPKKGAVLAFAICASHGHPELGRVLGCAVARGEIRPTFNLRGRPS